MTLQVSLRAMTPPDVPAVIEAQEAGAVIGLAAVFPQDEFPFPHDAVLERMRSAGVTRAWLSVFTGNERARRFYERLGWTPTGERSRSTFAPCPELLQYERGARRTGRVTPSSSSAARPPAPA